MRTVVITGANSGIGKAAALRFASEGWQVVMACRNVEKGQPARSEIARAAGNADVKLMELNVASFESVRRFSADFRRDHKRLDVLINNAGYFNHGIKSYQFSPDGLELTFATNVFGPLLLTELLRELLAESDDPRVLNAASTNIKHFFDPKRNIEFDNLRGEYAHSRPYEVYKMYGDSKMALLLLTYKMAQVYREQGIKVNAVMIPATKVSRETLTKFSGFYRVIAPLIQNLNPLSLTQQEMGDCYYDICTAEAFREVTGALVNSKRQILPPQSEPVNPLHVVRELVNTRHAPAYASNPVNLERMWKLSQAVIDKAPANNG
ncbi:MAG TPA: SDR family NAD(P)-dependent oxidoreductase [Symbiobacteriaceae bacterium]|nr:SDR family NAD(P)-dependent oxidoreductase [Symbiobacteriaceae bacterium]